MKRLLNFVRLGVRVASLALIALLVVTPLAQIVMRGVFNVPMSGAEELARYFLIALTFRPFPKAQPGAADAVAA